MATVTGILLLIVAISWLTNDIGCPNPRSPVPEPMTVMQKDTYDAIKKKLTILGIYDEAKAVSHFDRRPAQKVKSAWRTPEICREGFPIDKGAAEDNICNIVAVKLSEERTFLETSQTVTLTKSYQPYKCFKLQINNVKKKLGVLKPKKQVMYCPQTEVPINGNGSTKIRVPRFLIGRGDYRRNSIRVYRFNNGEKSMDLIYYLYDALTYFPMKINAETYKTARNKHLERKYALLGFADSLQEFFQYPKNIKNIAKSQLNKKSCSEIIDENRKTCEDLAVFRIATCDKTMKNSFLLPFNNQIINNDYQKIQNTEQFDTAGFLAYVCVNGPISNLKPVQKRDLVFCPQQIITGINNNKSYKQPAFLYSTDSYRNSYFIYDIEFEGIKVMTTNSQDRTDTRNADQMKNVPQTEAEVEVFKSIKLSNCVKFLEMTTILDKYGKKQINKEIEEDT